MKIEAAIRILLAGLYETDPAERPSPEEVSDARERIAATREGWESFADLFAAVTEKEPPNRELMESLFGCGEFMRRMEEFVGMSREQLAADEPDMAMHLHHCGTCAAALAAAESFVDDVQKDFATLEDGSPQSLRWREAMDSSRRRVLDLAGSLTYGFRDRLLQFFDFPGGMVPASAAAVRCGAGDSGGPRSDRVDQLTLRLPVGDVDASVRITSDESSSRITIMIELSGATPGDCDIELYEQSGDVFVAADHVSGRAPVVFSGVPAGDYDLRFTFAGVDDVVICRLDFVP